MPTSHHALWTPISNVIHAVQPKRVLDIGCGFGTYGALVRALTDVWNWRWVDGEYQTVIDGVEGWEEYRSVNWGHYGTVINADALAALRNMKDDAYDLGLLIEGLEHYAPDVAPELLHEIRRVCREAVVSWSNCPQDASRGNEYERHRSGWSVVGDFSGVGVYKFPLAPEEYRCFYNDGMTAAVHVLPKPV